MTDNTTIAAQIEALAPCPFCGGEAKRITIGDEEPNNAGGDVIVCTRCQVSSHVEFGRKENLISRWNTREAPAIVTALRQAEAASRVEVLRTAKITVTDEQLAYLNSLAAATKKATPSELPIHDIERAVAAVLVDGVELHRARLESAHDALSSAIGWPGLDVGRQAEAAPTQDTVAFVQKWMMSGDHEPTQWDRDFAAAINARCNPQAEAAPGVVEEIKGPLRFVDEGHPLGLVCYDRNGQAVSLHPAIRGAVFQILARQHGAREDTEGESVTLKAKILAALKDGPKTIPQVAEIIGREPSSAGYRLSELRTSGSIKRVDGGATYALADWTGDTAWGPADSPMLPLGLRRHPRWALRFSVTRTMKVDGESFDAPHLTQVYAHEWGDLIEIAALLKANPDAELFQLEEWTGNPMWEERPLSMLVTPEEPEPCACCGGDKEREEDDDCHKCANWKAGREP
jgi:Lar family restriction alleviation protein